MAMFERNQQLLDEAAKSKEFLEEIARELAVVKQQYFEEISRQQEQNLTSAVKESSD